MATDKPPDIQRLNPDRLVRGFRRVDVFAIGLALAVGLHALLVGVSSYRYIARQLSGESAAGEKGDEGAAGAPKAPARPDQPPESPPAAPAAPVPGDAAENIPDHLKGHPVVKELIDKAAPEEIPAEPPTKGIGLDETGAR